MECKRAEGSTKLHIHAFFTVRIPRLGTNSHNCTQHNTICSWHCSPFSSGYCCTAETIPSSHNNFTVNNNKKCFQESVTVAPCVQVDIHKMCHLASFKREITQFSYVFYDSTSAKEARTLTEKQKERRQINLT